MGSLVTSGIALSAFQAFAWFMDFEALGLVGVGAPAGLTSLGGCRLEDLFRCEELT